MVDAARALTIEGDRVRVPAAALEHAGFRSWATSEEYPDGIHASYVRREVLIQMRPESIETHNKVKRDVTTDLVSFIRVSDLGTAYVCARH